MKVQELQSVVLLFILVGLLVGVGIVIFDNFGTNVKLSSNIVNESITITAQTGTTANDDVTAVTYFGNSTVHCNPDATPACLTYNSLGQVFPSAVNAVANFTNSTSYRISYTYDADTPGTTVMTNMVSVIDDLPNTWIPLLITVVSLAVILGLVLSSFIIERR